MPKYVRHHNEDSGEYYWIRKDIHQKCSHSNSQEHRRRVLEVFYNSVENMVNGVIDYKLFQDKYLNK